MLSPHRVYSQLEKCHVFIFPLHPSNATSNLVVYSQLEKYQVLLFEFRKQGRTSSAFHIRLGNLFTAGKTSSAPFSESQQQRRTSSAAHTHPGSLFTAGKNVRNSFLDYTHPTLFTPNLGIYSVTDGKTSCDHFFQFQQQRRTSSVFHTHLGSLFTAG